MGASSYLTGIIACQKRKENPVPTLSDFDPDSYVVHPAIGDWRASLTGLGAHASMKISA
jgi:hypothetical protein